MESDALIGRTSSLVLTRETDVGFMVDGGELGEILVPAKFVPEDLEQGDELEVFVYRDSEDRLIATSEIPTVERGQFAMLDVAEVNPKIGAFLSWGLTKDLLLPFREQTERPSPGDKVLVYVLIDSKTQRLVASMRLKRFVKKDSQGLSIGDEVDALLYHKTPLGWNAIVNDRSQGLLYHNEFPEPPERGERLTAYVKKVRQDGGLDLSLNPSRGEQAQALHEEIMEALDQNDGFLPLGDKSEPAEIREAFGVSKKAFKQALGGLYKKKKISLEPGGKGIRKL